LCGALRSWHDWRCQCRIRPNPDTDSDTHSNRNGNGNADADSNCNGNSDPDSNSFRNAIGHTTTAYTDPDSDRVTNSEWEA
jgi:hypothetical protein